VVVFSEVVVFSDGPSEVVAFSSLTLEVVVEPSDFSVLVEVVRVVLGGF
jgi:hypothetical protein